MSNEIKEKEELEKYARENRKRLDTQEVKIGDVVKVLVGQFAGETGIVIGIIACDKSDYTDPYYEIEMECDVPEEFRVRKTLIGQSRVIGGVERRYLKVIGNRAPKQPSMGIKQGDRVRVSRDIPMFYRRYNSYRVFEVEHQVVDIEDGLALLDSIPPKFTTILPCKYLVKVDAEAKEAKFKKGDKVRYIGNIQEHKGEMFVIDGDIFFNDYYKQWQASSIKTTPTEVWGICNVPLSDLEPDTKPTEQTEAEKPNIGSIKIPVEVDLTDSYWYAYAAELAKEIALKVANKYNDPEQAAEYAVSVAKAVVEGLKRE